ncbi:MAG: MarR family transcriptional regulator [Alphaproteobacteria bacterium PA2]|nr:MAG: MarR family transcriptional regulator [Alphaproteobacteria bacterium PA2]
MTRDQNPVDDGQAHTLAALLSVLMRRFKLEPGLLASSVYADLHANDAGLLNVLTEADDWTVRTLAQTLGAADSTVSSALDRLEARGLVARTRLERDRRVMGVRLTDEGVALIARLREAQLGNSRALLERLTEDDRGQLLRLLAIMAQDR